MTEETFYIGQEFEDTYPEMADLWCHANNAHLIQIGSKYIIVSNESMPLPTKEDIKLFRANAYLLEVDPITSHISRLRDEEQTEGVKQEIEDFIYKEEYLLISTHDLLKILEEDNFQWIWGVFSAIPSKYSKEEILKLRKMIQ